MDKPMKDARIEVRYSGNYSASRGCEWEKDIDIFIPEHMSLEQLAKNSEIERCNKMFPNRVFFSRDTCSPLIACMYPGEGNYWPKPLDMREEVPSKVSLYIINLVEEPVATRIIEHLEKFSRQS
jgi:hypothetical protein